MGRRRRGDGTVYRRKEGRYEAACWVNTPQGTKRVRRYATTRNDAEAILVELRFKHDSGIKQNSKEQKLGAYMDYWLAELKASSIVRRSTLESYEATVRLYLKPGLGNKCLTMLTVPDAQLFINNQLRLGQSHRNVQKMKIVLSAILRRALKEERTTRNVARDVEIPPYRPKEVKPWSLDQLASFWMAAANHPYYPIYFLMGFYGLRSGEALGISWSDIDMDKKVIRIRKQIDYANNSYTYAELKTEAGRRDLPIPPNTQAILSKLKPTTIGPLPDLVFKTKSGRPIDRGNLRRTFKLISKKAGLPVINPHHLRHTAATNLKNLDIAPRDVQAILGHAHISTTLQIYQHSDMAGKTNAFKKYEREITDISASSRQVKPSGNKIMAEYIKINGGAQGLILAKDLRLMSPVL